MNWYSPVRRPLMRLETSGTTTKRSVLIGGRPPPAPIVVMRIEQQGLVGPELAHLVRAGRHRLARPFDPVLGLHEATPADDLAGRAGEAALQRDVGDAIDETHRIAV